jgi:hypothetical protein
MGEPFVVVLWERARTQETRILDDLARRFVLCDVVEVHWPRATFRRGLTRVYGEALPPGSDKEAECGTGPFLVIAGRDPRPHHGLRRTTRGSALVNTRLARAKRRYRRWTGGGFRVHGSLDAREAERDLRLFLGAGSDDVLRRRWDGTVRELRVDRVSWPDTRALLAAVSAATPAVVVSDGPHGLRMRADDVWWAAVIAGADTPAADATSAETVTEIGGHAVALTIETLGAQLSRA